MRVHRPDNHRSSLVGLSAVVEFYLCISSGLIRSHIVSAWRQLQHPYYLYALGRLGLTPFTVQALKMLSNPDSKSHFDPETPTAPYTYIWQGKTCRLENLRAREDRTTHLGFVRPLSCLPPISLQRCLYVLSHFHSSERENYLRKSI